MQTRVLTMKFILGSDRYPDAPSLRTFNDRVLAEVRAVPGVESAAVVNHLPLNHEASTLPYRIPGEPVEAAGGVRRAIEVAVSPDYFRTMGIPLREGRDVDARDTDQRTPVALVNRTLASRVWGDSSPIGQELEVGTAGVRVTVIGLVEDARQRELVGEAEPILYRPAAQVVRRHGRVVVRTAGDPLSFVDAAQRAVWRADAALPLTEVRSLDQVVADFLLPQRAMTVSMANMGVTGLLVTAIGLYGLLAVIVAQRRREIGVRMALGAGRHRVVADLVWRCVRTTGIGLVCGVALSVVLTMSLASLLPGARAVDPLAIGGTVLLLALVALASSFVPARRATRIDPLIVLRTN